MINRSAMKYIEGAPHNRSCRTPSNACLNRQVSKNSSNELISKNHRHATNINSKELKTSLEKKVLGSIDSGH